MNAPTPLNYGGKYMRLPVKEYIRNNVMESYAIEGELHYKVDCGDGINITSVSEKTMEAFLKLSVELAKGYPHSISLKQKIADIWGEYADIEINRIFLGDGSQTLLYNTCRLFLEVGDEVLGLAPTYPVTPCDVRMWGCKYDPVFLKEEENFRFNVQDMLDKIDGRHKLICIDNPNNPTGQVIKKEDIEKILKKAAEYSTPVIIDESYGDYMNPQNSVVSLVNEYDNLIWIKSLSKGYGLAGLRAGYGVIPHELVPMMINITHPYIMNSISRFIAEKVLNDSGFLGKVRAETREIKEMLNQEWKNLTISYADPEVSICLITHKDKKFKLKEAFDKEDICVVSGGNFLGLDENSIRFRVPKQEDMNIVLVAIRKIDEQSSV